MLRKLLLILSLAGLAPLAHAGPGQGKAVRDEVKERIRALRIARIIEILDLDETGASRLAPIIDRAYDEIALVSKDSGEARRELKILVLAQAPDDARLNGLIDRLIENKRKVDAIETDMIAQVRRVITASQAARLVVALPEINHQIQDQIKKAIGPNLGGPKRDPF